MRGEIDGGGERLDLGNITVRNGLGDIGQGGVAEGDGVAPQHS